MGEDKKAADKWAADKWAADKKAADKNAAGRSGRTRLQDAAIAAVFFLILGGGMALHLLTPDRERSDTERRVLEQFPQAEVETLLSGEFFRELESYGADQFPARDRFLQMRAEGTAGWLGELDAEGYYQAEGHIGRLEDAPSEASVKRAAEIYRQLAGEYGSQGRVYYTVVPSKNRYLAASHGYPAADYEAADQLLREQLEDIEEIPIAGLLDAEDYYRTDLHWRQEALVETADVLLAGMGNEARASLAGYEEKDGGAFAGTYARQSFLPAEADRLYYMENSDTREAAVYDWETGGIGPVYQEEALGGRDPYDVFLSGAKALLTVDNPLAAEERELIIFRDSFGSSLAPLLLCGYSRITLVDLRYISRTALREYLQPSENCDILFACNDGILADSAMIDRP